MLPYDGFVPYPKRQNARLARDVFPHSADFWRWRWDFSEVLDEFCTLIAFQSHFSRWYCVGTELLEMIDHREEHDFNVQTVYQRRRGKSYVSKATYVPHWASSCSNMLEMRRARRFAKRNPLRGDKMMGDDRIQWLLQTKGLGDHILKFLKPEWWTGLEYLVEPLSYGVTHCLPDWFAKQLHGLQTRYKLENVCNSFWHFLMQVDTAVTMSLNSGESSPRNHRLNAMACNISITTASWYIAEYMLQSSDLWTLTVFPGDSWEGCPHYVHWAWQHHETSVYNMGRHWQFQARWGMGFNYYFVTTVRTLVRSGDD